MDRYAAFVNSIALQINTLQSELDAFFDKAKQDPLHSFEWADLMVAKAAALKVYKVAKNWLQAPFDEDNTEEKRLGAIARHARSEAMRYVRSGPRYTSGVAGACERAEAQAWAQFAEQIDLNS